MFHVERGEVNMFHVEHVHKTLVSNVFYYCVQERS